MKIISNVTDTFAGCTLTVEFQALLLQVFDSVFVTSAKIHSNIVGIDRHLDLSQEEQSLAVAVMTLQRKLTFSFLQLCSKEAQQSLPNSFEQILPLAKEVLSKWPASHHKQLFCQRKASVL